MSDFKIVQLLNPIQINVPINPTGVYNAATTYGIGDSVSYGNSSYICILASTGNVPTNTTYWQLLASSSTNKLSTTARNQTGVTIPSETVVYFSGVSGNVPTLALSQANTELGSTKTIGITATSIANNANGEVVVFGLADNLNTSAFTAGSALWLSPSVPGGLTMTKPSAPNHMVFIGFCTRSHPTQGTIEVKIQNGFELEELHNVAISSLSDNQVLKYDAPNLLWKNETLVKGDVGLGNVPNVDTTNPSNIVEDSTHRFVTDTEKTTWNGKEDAIISGTTAQYWRGDKSFQTLDKSAVGLGNVDNTSDSNKPVSTAQQTALNLKVDKAGDTMTGILEIDVTLASTSPLIFIKNQSPNGTASLVTTNDTTNFLSFGVTGSTITGLPIPNDEAFLYSSNAINAVTTLADGFKWYQDGTQVASIVNGLFSSNGISLNSGTVENVPTPTATTDAANKDYVDTGLATKVDSSLIGAPLGLATLDAAGLVPLSQLPATMGADGLSAYEVALDNGFVGTEAAWLASLVGADGADGDSSYQVALNNGFIGTEAAWLASLVGAAGADGSVWLSGIGIPSSGLGVDGDYYINTSNSDVYKKATGTFTFLLNIKGATGDAGAVTALDAGTSTTIFDSLSILDGGEVI